MALSCSLCGVEFPLEGIIPIGAEAPAVSPALSSPFIVVCVPPLLTFVTLGCDAELMVVLLCESTAGVPNQRSLRPLIFTRDAPLFIYS